MSDPVRLRDVPESQRDLAGRFLAGTEAAREWPRERRVAARWAFQLRMNALTSPRTPRARRPLAHLLPAAAAVVAVIALAALSVGPHLRALWPARAPQQPVTEPSASSPAWRRIDLAGVGSFEFSPSARYDLHETEAERQLVLTAGMLRAQVQHQDPERPVVVSTPWLRVVVVGTRFDVTVDETGASVEVLEGRVRIEREEARTFVSAGEAIRSNDPRLVNSLAGPAPSAAVDVPDLTLSRKSGPIGPAAPDALPRPRWAMKDCAHPRTVAAQKRCLLLQARHSGLEAQTALIALAQIARDIDGEPQQALEYYRLHELRFPDGALAPEVALGILGTLQEQGRTAEAVAAASAFEQRFPDDPRAPEVALVRAELLCQRPERRLEALAVLEQLQRGDSPKVRTQAAAARARCQRPQEGGDPLRLLSGSQGAAAPP